MHAVYKYVYNGNIIYIGKSDVGVYERISQHGRSGDNIPEDAWSELKKSDVFYIELPNRTMTDVVESELIRRYRPKYNKAKKSEWKGLPFAEPEWTRFNKECLKKKSSCFVNKTDFCVFDGGGGTNDLYFFKIRDKDKGIVKITKHYQCLHENWMGLSDECFDDEDDEWANNSFNEYIKRCIEEKNDVGFSTHYYRQYRFDALFKKEVIDTNIPYAYHFNDWLYIGDQKHHKISFPVDDNDESVWPTAIAMACEVLTMRGETEIGGIPIWQAYKPFWQGEYYDWTENADRNGICRIKRSN